MLFSLFSPFSFYLVVATRALEPDATVDDDSYYTGGTYYYVQAADDDQE